MSIWSEGQCREILARVLAGEVPLSGVHGLPAAASVVHLEAPPPTEPMPRWIPIAVIGTALVIAIAIAYVIGVS